jgi:phosphate:Na+ symporter
LLDLAGIIALLLWGVHMVQTGVQRAFGAGLRTFLSRRLQNRFSAFLAGLTITAVLQSSTATGLMVTGFARQGLVRLSQGLAVMLGANVGSTLIVQLLAFPIARVAPILILFGYLLFRRARAGTRDFGRVLIGLGLVLLALHQFLGLLEPLAATSGMRSVFAAFSTHIVFIVLLGTVLTWAAHSSVAIVLLAMGLAAQGVLDVPAGIALALGANLGTAINPVLEGEAKSAADRRLPLGNLLNRLAGVAVVLACYPLVAPLMTSIEGDPARAIANFHTGFNLVLAILFLPLLTPYARLLTRWLKAPNEEASPDAPRYLEAAGADKPVAAVLAGATREALRLADILEAMIASLRESLIAPDRRQIEDARRLDDRLDRLSRAIKENLLKVDTAGLSDGDSQKLARILSFAINLEQAGDLIDRGLLAVGTRRLKRGISFSKQGEEDLVMLSDKLTDILRQSTAVFLSGDIEAARQLAQQKQALRAADQQASEAHFARLRAGEIETIETSALHLDALRDLRQIGGHLIEGSAYPILKDRGELLPTRLRLPGNAA